MARKSNRPPADGMQRTLGYCRVSTAEHTEGVSHYEQERRIRGRALGRRHVAPA